MKPKRVFLLDGANRIEFPSIDAAAAYCSGYHKSLLEALKAGRTYKGLCFVFEGQHKKPLMPKRGNFINHPNSRQVSEFRNGDLVCIHKSQREAAREMGFSHRTLRDILSGNRVNRTGKDFAHATPLDECLIEIRERNKRPYQ